MSVVLALGLDDDRVIDLMERRWLQWCQEMPSLGLLTEPALVDVWRRSAPAQDVDSVLLGLAELAADDGGDDVDAAAVLAWLLLPSAVRLSAELVEADRDIDEHIAACLWIEVRTFDWRTSRRVAANIAWRLRRRVLMEIGDLSRLDSHGDRTRARTVVDDEIARVDVEDLDPYSATAADALLSVLAWGCAQGVITSAERLLLIDLVAAASISSGLPDSIPLLGNRASDRVATRWGTSGRTVRRRAKASIAALARAVQNEGRSAALRRIA
jgi:hypothetical protein